MPECNHCGHFVTEQYVRVFLPTDAEGVECCPWCEDRVRAGGGIRDARSVTRGGLSDSTREDTSAAGTDGVRYGEPVPELGGAD